MLLVLAMLGLRIPDSLAEQAVTPARAKTKLAVVPFTGPASPDGYGAMLGQALRDGLQRGETASR